jgi:4-hydroxy-tetrahydrodipicolinate reductase
MGDEVLAAASERDDVRVVGTVSRNESVGRGHDDVQTVQPEEFGTLLADERPDAVVDFTTPEATVGYAGTCAEHGVAFVTGTTGLDEQQAVAVRAAGETIPVLSASNFSRGVAALRRAVAAAVTAVPGYDVEVTETHHNSKRDAPSGTAETLVSEIETARPDLDTRQHGREGVTPRSAGEIGIHARRAGSVTGEHEVLLAGEDNVLSLTHRAGSRRVFAAGALDAAVWLAGRDAGTYEFDDVLDETPTNAAPATNGGDPR